MGTHCSKQEHKAVFYLTVNIRGGAKIVKRTALNHKDKFAKYLNLAETQRFLTQNIVAL